MALRNTLQRYDHTDLFGELYMKEEILTTHIGINSPTTNILNESNYPIEGIWCSLGLTAL